MIHKKKRVLGIDIIRGLALINMVIYHLLYDLAYIFGQSISWFSIRKCFVWQQMICFTFIIVSGCSFRLSRRPYKNGLTIMLGAMVLSAATLLVIPDELIVFGILHFLAAAILLTMLMRPVLMRIPAKIGLPLALILFVVFRNLPSGYLSIFTFAQYPLPPSLYQTSFLFWIGLPQASFASADYFPLFPWWFLYLAGFYFHDYYLRSADYLQEKYALADKKIYQAFGCSFGLLGRHSLLIYMLHQPIIYGVLTLFFHLRH
jgi:uncharacterized membrane protein